MKLELLTQAMKQASDPRRSLNGSISAEPYNYPHDGSFNPLSTALVVIDMQRDCMRPSTSIPRSNVLTD